MDTKILRQKILDLAIRGKLVKQDANEEPANVLLARIRKEKERLVKEGKLKKKDLVTTPVSDEDKPFEVPEGWEWVTVKDICSKFTTGPFGSMVHKTDYITNGGVPLVNPANMIDGEICMNKIMYVSIDKSEELQKYKLESSDVLLARRGDLTKCVIIREQQAGWLCGTGAFVLHAILLDPQYFSLIYSSTYIQSTLKKESVGATMDNLNQGLLGSLPIPLPPLSEQQRIVAEVEKWMSLIDTIENGKENLLQSIATAKSKILTLAVKGKLVPQDANDEPAGMLLMRIGCKYIESDKESPFKLPSSWIWTNMNGCNKYKSLSINPSKSPDKDYELYSVPTFETGMPEFIKGERISSSKKRVEKGDVLLCKINPHLNRAWEVSHHKPQRTCIASSEWIIFRNNNINAKYLIHCFQSPYFKELMLSNVSGVGGSLMRAQPACVLKYPFPLPPLSEQQRVVTKIEQIFAQLDSIAAAIKS